MNKIDIRAGAEIEVSEIIFADDNSRNYHAVQVGFNDRGCFFEDVDGDGTYQFRLEDLPNMIKALQKLQELKGESNGN